MSRLIPLQQGILYGPIRSKRLGRSLGVNLFPSDRKVCSFDCAYCHFGETTHHELPTASGQRPAGYPTGDEVLAAVAAVLRSDTEFEYVTLSGNGEPTMYPEFHELVPRLQELVHRLRPEVRLALLSNSSTVGDESLYPAFELIDEPVFKLDAGDQATFEALNRPCPGLKIADIVAGLARLAARKALTLQTVLVSGPVKNHEGPAFRHWLQAVARIRPARIQLYTTDRPVSDLRVTKLDDDALEAKATEVNSLTGIETKAYH